MYRNKKVLGIIPARAGSKGIPHKNIINVGGKPLIQYTIDEARKSVYLDCIIVSTDDQKIARISKECGAEVPFLRPKYLAEDHSKTIDTVLHVIHKLEELKRYYDYVVLLQPTQPLRKSWHIDEAIEKIITENMDSLVSVSEVKENPILIRTINKEGRLENLLNIESTVRRQEFPKYYKVNGAVYINQINERLNNQTSLNDNKIAYVMDSQYDLDIDDPIDLEIFNCIKSLKS